MEAGGWWTRSGQRRAQPEQLTGKGETKRVNETYFEQLLQWLARCPALAGIALRVDDLHNGARDVCAAGASG